MQIAILDPSLATDNLGDEVIYQAVESLLFDLFPNAWFHRIATHEPMSNRSHKVLRAAERIFVAGSNLLPPDGGQWRITLSDSMFVEGLVVIGAGWQHDATKLTREASKILRRSLHASALHAVRDAPAAENLKALGLRAVNATCPTLWRLDAAATARIPEAKAQDAVVAVTAYRNQPEADAAFLKLVTDRYRTVWFYPQMGDDIPHLERLGFGHLKRIRASTEAYSRFLAENDVDYIGSRLHGGIRALQMGKRLLILEVDNRARDIAAHTGLPSARLTDLAAISDWIERPAPTRLHLPEAEIAAWKAQFA
ncbi:polysaccharide pyruvyl transferase family protein [Elioraea rosea]|uniref:polysaccharide pyruvyl transferase family protein n=1 Tax=Elioraea rosea TaxID=2492390 RepID=UPI001182228A|nr:polysaccharide pyruvyl transferase family protein [Elioraea rosea]